MLSHKSRVYGVSDAKIYKLLTDPAGGSATYAAGIDVPGIRTMSLAGTIATKDLRGDNTLLASDSTFEGATLSFEFAKLDFDILAILLGGTVTDAGTTPAQTASWSVPRIPVFGEFKIEGVAARGDDPAGDLHVTAFKCVLSAFPDLGFANEDHKLQTMQARVYPRESDGKWLDVVRNETAVAIAA